MRKFIGVVMGLALMAGVMAGCGNKDAGSGSSTSGQVQSASEQNSGSSSTDFDLGTEITVVSREDGSGTRGAFVELFEIEQKDESGEKVDYTTEEAIITNNTSVMMTTVSGDKYAIGYVSLGSLNDTVKAVKIDGVEVSVENIKNDTYKVARPFNIAVNGEVSDVTNDFLNYIMSSDGQAVIVDNGYISVSEETAFESDMSEGKIVIAGSSSVTPVMEKLKEAYLEINTNADIEIQESDSSTGMSNTIEGICDIGMASRDLKDSELEAGLTSTTIAMDGIAVIVNNDSVVDELSSEDVKNIFMGEVLEWSEVYE